MINEHQAHLGPPVDLIMLSAVDVCTNSNRSWLRSGLASSGLARKPRPKRVVSMHTPTFSVICPMRSTVSCMIRTLIGEQLSARKCSREAEFSREAKAVPLCICANASASQSASAGAGFVAGNCTAQSFFRERRVRLTRLRHIPH